MKNFLKFLLLSLLIIAAFITYNILNPTNGMIVRQGANWVILDRNESK